MDVSGVLLQQGLSGVVILVEGFVIMRLYNDGKKLQDKFDALQDARRVDAVEAIDKVTQPLSGISQTLGLVYDKLTGNK